MKIDGLYLWKALHQPSTLADLNGRQLSDLVRLAWRQGLAPRLGLEADKAGILSSLPAQAQAALGDLVIDGETYRRRLQFETERINSALRDAGFPVVLLKGGAYGAAKLPFAAARISTDVDILVPKSALLACENALTAAGWVMEAKSEYDDVYYREWMHELPPMRHEIRKTVIDVHHTIVPPVARITPAPDKIIEDAVATDFDTLMRPNLVDMFIHCALHTFYDGDFAGALRAFVDLRDLMTAGLQDSPDFIDAVIARSNLHEAQRPVSDALTMLAQYADLTLTETQKGFIRQYGRLAPIQSTLDWAVFQRAFACVPFRYRDAWLPRFVLYARGHWITMPPGMLVRHTSSRIWQKWTGQL